MKKIQNPKMDKSLIILMKNLLQIQDVLIIKVCWECLVLNLNFLKTYISAEVSVIMESLTTLRSIDINE